MHESRVVIALVEVFQNGTEDLRLFVGKGNALRGGIHVTVAEGMGEKRAVAEDFLVGGEQALFSTDDERDDGRSHVVAHDAIVSCGSSRGRRRPTMPRLMSSLSHTVVFAKGRRLAERRRRLALPVALCEALVRSGKHDGERDGFDRELVSNCN